MKALAACYTRDANREIVPLSPRGTVWYHYYVLDPPVHDNNFQKKFRHRFRLPYDKFLEIFAQAKKSPLFRRWTSFDAVGKESSPIELMILGALRYLGRGWTFDDIEEATTINEETHRQFFHIYIAFVSTELYKHFVIVPTSG